MFSFLGRIIGANRIAGIVAALVSFLFAFFPQFRNAAGSRKGDAVHTAPASEQIQAVNASPSETPYANPSAADSKNDDGVGYSKEDIFKGLELDDGFNLKRDWWKYMLLALGSLLILYFGLRVTRMLLRLFVFLLSIAGGVVCAIVIEPYVTPLLEPYLPEKLLNIISSQHVGYVIGFLISYIVLSLIISIMPKRIVSDGKGGKGER